MHNPMLHWKPKTCSNNYDHSWWRIISPRQPEIIVGSDGGGGGGGGRFVSLSDEPVLELVGQGPAPRVKGVGEAVAGQVGHPARVDVRKAEQLAGEVGGIVVGAE